MIETETRKHGPFDPRFPRPRVLVDGAMLEQAVDRISLDTWEGEGGQVGLLSRRASGGNGLRRSWPVSLPDGLSWESFCALAYPDENRHFFPAIAAWYRYRDGDRSWPRGSRPRTAIAIVSTSRALESSASPSRRPSQPVTREASIASKGAPSASQSTTNEGEFHESAAVG
jgi:hypothetical protein